MATVVGSVAAAVEVWVEVAEAAEKVAAAAAAMVCESEVEVAAVMARRLRWWVYRMVHCGVLHRRSHVGGAAAAAAAAAAFGSTGSPTPVVGLAFTQHSHCVPLYHRVRRFY